MTQTSAKKIAADLKASVRYRIRSKMEMPVLDLAEGGCMLDSRGWGVKPDERVQVKLPGLAEMGARVVWIEDQRAGVAFEEPIYGPVIERFFCAKQ